MVVLVVKSTHRREGKAVPLAAPSSSKRRMTWTRRRASNPSESRHPMTSGSAPTFVDQVGPEDRFEFEDQVALEFRSGFEDKVAKDFVGGFDMDCVLEFEKDLRSRLERDLHKFPDYHLQPWQTIVAVFFRINELPNLLD